MKANIVDEFWNNSAVTDADRQDLALKIDNSRLQEVRNACAGLHREHENEDSYYDSMRDRTTMKGC